MHKLSCSLLDKASASDRLHVSMFRTLDSLLKHGSPNVQVTHCNDACGSCSHSQQVSTMTLLPMPAWACCQPSSGPNRSWRQPPQYGRLTPALPGRTQPARGIVDVLLD